MKKKEIDCCWKSSKNILKKTVNERQVEFKIKEGWILQGGISSRKDGLIQAMTRMKN